MNKKNFSYLIKKGLSTFSKRYILKLLMFFKENISYSDKKNILIWDPGGGGWPDLIDVEGTIACALKMKGHNVQAIISDESTIAYSKRTILEGINLNDWAKAFQKCIKECEKGLKIFGVEYSYIGNFVSPDEKQEALKISKSICYQDLDDFYYKGYKIGRVIKGSIIRFLQGKPFSDCESSILREFAYKAIINTISASNSINQIKPSLVLLSHSVYVEWGAATRVFLSNNIPVTTYSTQFTKGCFFFKSIIDPEHNEPMNITQESWDKYKKENLSRFEKEKVDSFFFKRYFKNRSLDIKFDPKDELLIDDFKKKYNLLNESRPIWAVFTHITWDAVVDFNPMIFSSIEEWLEITIQEIKKHKDVIWLIKIHPQEENIKSNYNLGETFKNIDIPENIRIIPSNEKFNPYYFQQMIDGGVTCYGTAGLELSLLGKPVIVCGKAHYSGKNFTIDSRSKEEYLKNLGKIKTFSKLNSHQINSAYSYCHITLFKRHIRIPILHSKDYPFKFQLNKVLDIFPGKEKNISFICKTFIENKDPDYILDEAQYVD